MIDLMKLYIQKAWQIIIKSVSKSARNLIVIY